DAVGELKTALQGDDTEAIKAASEKVATESQQLGQALYAQQQSEGGAAGAAGAAGDTGTDPGQADDVVDAEIVDDDKKQ
ncbi:MAG TPA: molecular chaperone DnaK, partial [Pseudonocardia sp.]|nr:molecular chaperone DnaK [Pseudonocardia sp.]